MNACAATRHGTASAYTKARCRCPEAREAWRLYNKRRREGRQLPGLLSPLGASRRIQALVAIGWTWRALAREAERHHRTVRDIGTARRETVTNVTLVWVHELYERLSYTSGGSKYALTVAARYGWCPPEAWRNIDDPDAQPYDVEPSVDSVAVEQALDGAPIQLTPIERHHAVHTGLARGISLSLISDRIHVSYATAQTLAAQPLPVGYELVA
jgi:hypothetical protein